MVLFDFIRFLLPNTRVRRKYGYKLLNLLSRNNQARLMYFLKTGKYLDLKKPKRFTEKIIWYKLNYDNELIHQLQDKYLVRDYVEKKGLGNILNDVYAIKDSIDEVNFEILPREYVLKNTKGDYAKEVIIIDKNNKMTSNDIKNIVRNWVKYEGQKIIIEPLLPKDENGNFYDYKFFCFNGHVECLYVMDNYALGGHRLSFYDRDFNDLHAYRSDYAPPINYQLKKPKNYEDMICVAESLSKDFPHVRVDLYNIDGKIVFGELTFYTSGGQCTFEPDSFDYWLGDKFILPKKENEK